MLLIRHAHLIDDDCCGPAPALRSIWPRCHLDHGVQVSRPPNACKASQSLEQPNLSFNRLAQWGTLP